VYALPQNCVIERREARAVFEGALFLLTASKKGVLAHQIHRSLDISCKSAWFMMHRLREALRTGGLARLGGKWEARLRVIEEGISFDAINTAISDPAPFSEIQALGLDQSVATG
jgi:hypothetical protein